MRTLNTFHNIKYGTLISNKRLSTSFKTYKIYLCIRVVIDNACILQTVKKASPVKEAPPPTPPKSAGELRDV